MNKANHQAESYDVDIKYLHIDQSHHVNNNISREYASHNKSLSAVFRKWEWHPAP